MVYAFVTTNLLDLRARPRFDSERLSQLFFGEVVTTGAKRKGYFRVIQTDGYAGWADARFLSPVAKRSALEYRRSLNFIVIANQARLLDPVKRGSEQPHFLYFGTPVRRQSARAGIATCRLPGGKMVKLKQNSLRPINSIRGVAPSGSRIAREATRFLGVPYLWGGISPAGFDCSGLVKTVFATYGVYLPRDTKDQIKVGAPIERSEVKAGDLLFFKRHVALATGRDRIIHASQGGSGVRLNSLTPDGDDYREDLNLSFATARRVF